MKSTSTSTLARVVFTGALLLGAQALDRTTEAGEAAIHGACLAFILCLYRPRPRLFLHPRSPLLSIYYTPTETYWDTTHRPNSRMHALLLPARRRCSRRWTVPAHLGARHERPRQRYGREGEVPGDERERASDFAEGAFPFLPV